MSNDQDRPERIPRSEIRLEFVERKDRDGKKYYLAKTFLPATIDLRNTAFFIWPGDCWKDPSMTIVPIRPGRNEKVTEDEADDTDDRRR